MRNTQYVFQKYAALQPCPFNVCFNPTVVSEEKVLRGNANFTSHLSPKVFVREYCHAMKLAERYKASRIKKYGAAVETFAPFQRQLHVFKTEQGRQAILACCRSQLKLAGNDCGGGIPECIKIDEEMDKALAGKAKEKVEIPAVTQAAGSAPEANQTGESAAASVERMDDPDEDGIIIHIPADEQNSLHKDTLPQLCAFPLSDGPHEWPVPF